MKKRIIVLALVFIGAFLVILGGKCVYDSIKSDKNAPITQEQLDQMVAEAVRKNNEQEKDASESSAKPAEGAQAPSETANEPADTQEPEQTDPEPTQEPKPANPTEPPEVILLETAYNLKKRGPVAYDSAFSAMDESPIKLNKVGKVTIMAFSTQIQEVSVSSNVDNFQNYKQLVLSENSNVEEGGYYSFDFSPEAETRYIFRLTITTGENFYFSIQAPKK